MYKGQRDGVANQLVNVAANHWIGMLQVARENVVQLHASIDTLSDRLDVSEHKLTERQDLNDHRTERIQASLDHLTSALIESGIDRETR